MGKKGWKFRAGKVRVFVLLFFFILFLFLLLFFFFTFSHTGHASFFKFSFNSSDK